jgi:hypothetical protein
MFLRTVPAARRLLALATLAVVTTLAPGCAGNGSSANSSAVIPGQAANGVENSTQSIVRVPSGPTIRVMPDGSIIHIYLPPWERSNVVPNTNPVDYHGGKVNDRSKLFAIYWQPSGFYMSPKYKPTINRFFDDVGSGTKMYDILTQYTDKDGAPKNASSRGGAWTDTTPFPAKMDDAVVRAEVGKAIVKNQWPTGGYNAIFVVFTASKAKVNFALCAYHGSYKSGTQQVIYSIVPYQHDVGPTGCGTPTHKWPNDRDADQTIDTLWHEEAESISDPVQAWWRDSDGQEIGDICQTSYGPRFKDGGDVTLNGHDYITQELQSNKDHKCVQQEP